MHMSPINHMMYLDIATCIMINFTPIHTGVKIALVAAIIVSSILHYIKQFVTEGKWATNAARVGMYVCALVGLIYPIYFMEWLIIIPMAVSLIAKIILDIATS